MVLWFLTSIICFESQWDNATKSRMMPVTKIKCLTKLDLKALFKIIPLIGFLKLGTNEHPSLDLKLKSMKKIFLGQLSLLELVFGAKLSSLEQWSWDGFWVYSGDFSNPVTVPSSLFLVQDLCGGVGGGGETENWGRKLGYIVKLWLLVC